jgi:hypothetical protein
MVTPTDLIFLFFYYYYFKNIFTSLALHLRGFLKEACTL